MSLEPVFLPSDSSRPKITVHPEPRQEETHSVTRPRKSFQKATLGDNNPNAWGGDGFGVDDFIDLVNPLQHIPVVGHIYRALTGDTAATESKILGGAVFGGPIGLVSSAVTAIIEQESGQSITQTAAALTKDAPAAPVAKPALPEPQKLSALAPLPELPKLKPPAPATLEDIAPKVAPVSVPEVKTPISQKEQDKHDAILELFGDKLASLQDDYMQHQLMGYAQEAERSLTS